MTDFKSMLFSERHKRHSGVRLSPFNYTHKAHICIYQTPESSIFFFKEHKRKLHKKDSPCTLKTLPCNLQENVTLRQKDKSSQVLKSTMLY